MNWIVKEFPSLQHREVLIMLGKAAGIEVWGSCEFYTKENPHLIHVNLGSITNYLNSRWIMCAYNCSSSVSIYRLYNPTEITYEEALKFLTELINKQQKNDDN